MTPRGRDADLLLRAAGGLAADRLPADFAALLALTAGFDADFAPDLAAGTCPECVLPLGGALLADLLTALAAGAPGRGRVDLDLGAGRGVFGLDAGAFAATEEIVALAQIVRAKGGRYFTHLRDEAAAVPLPKSSLCA